MPSATYVPAVAEGVLSLRGGGAAPADQQVGGSRVGQMAAAGGCCLSWRGFLDFLAMDGATGVVAVKRASSASLPATPPHSATLLPTCAQAARHAASLAAAAGQQAEVAMLCLERLISLGKLLLSSMSSGGLLLRPLKVLGRAVTKPYCTPNCLAARDLRSPPALLIPHAIAAGPPGFSL